MTRKPGGHRAPTTSEIVSAAAQSPQTAGDTRAGTAEAAECSSRQTSPPGSAPAPTAGPRHVAAGEHSLPVSENTRWPPRALLSVRTVAAGRQPKGKADMTHTATEPVASGQPYLITEINGRTPQSLHDFTGDIELTAMRRRTTAETDRAATETHGAVRFQQRPRTRRSGRPGLDHHRTRHREPSSADPPPPSDRPIKARLGGPEPEWPAAPR